MRDKVVRSKYFILVNSNTSIYNRSPEGRKRLNNFISGIKHIFFTKDVLNFIKILDEDDVDKPLYKLLNEIDIDINFEYGDNNDFLHAHIIVSIDHMSKIKFITNRIVRFFNLKYNMSVFVPPPKLVSDNTVSVVNYAKKQMKKKFLIIASRINYIDGDMEFFNDVIRN